MSSRANNLIEIETRFLDLLEADRMGALDYIESKDLILNNIKTFNKEQEYKTFISLCSLEMGYLIIQGRYNRVIEVVRTRLEVMELHNKKFEYKLVRGDFIQILEYFATALTCMDQKEDALLVYERLQLEDPKNEHHKQIADSIRAKRKQGPDYLLYGFIGSIILFELLRIFGKENEYKIWALTLTIFLGLALLLRWFSRKK
ncbi:MAG: hypothetical protein ACYC1Q_11170 [Bacteroidia bacterium]